MSGHNFQEQAKTEDPNVNLNTDDGDDCVKEGIDVHDTCNQKITKLVQEIKTRDDAINLLKKALGDCKNQQDVYSSETASQVHHFGKDIDSFEQEFKQAIEAQKEENENLKVEVKNIEKDKEDTIKDLRLQYESRIEELIYSYNSELAAIANKISNTAIDENVNNELTNDFAAVLSTSEHGEQFSFLSEKLDRINSNFIRELNDRKACEQSYVELKVLYDENVIQCQNKEQDILYELSLHKTKFLDAEAEIQSLQHHLEKQIETHHKENLINLENHHNEIAKLQKQREDIENEMKLKEDGTLALKEDFNLLKSEYTEVKERLETEKLLKYQLKKLEQLRVTGDSKDDAEDTTKQLQHQITLLYEKGLKVGLQDGSAIETCSDNQTVDLMAKSASVIMKDGSCQTSKQNFGNMTVHTIEEDYLVEEIYVTPTRTLNADQLRIDKKTDSSSECTDAPKEIDKFESLKEDDIKLKQNCDVEKQTDIPMIQLPLLASSLDGKYDENEKSIGSHYVNSNLVVEAAEPSEDAINQKLNDALINYIKSNGSILVEDSVVLATASESNPDRTIVDWRKQMLNAIQAIMNNFTKGNKENVLEPVLKYDYGGIRYFPSKLDHEGHAQLLNDFQDITSAMLDEAQQEKVQLLQNQRIMLIGILESCQAKVEEICQNHLKNFNDSSYSSDFESEVKTLLEAVNHSVSEEVKWSETAYTDILQQYAHEQTRTSRSHYLTMTEFRNRVFSSMESSNQTIAMNRMSSSRENVSSIMPLLTQLALNLLHYYSVSESISKDPTGTSSGLSSSSGIASTDHGRDLEWCEAALGTYDGSASFHDNSPLALPMSVPSLDTTGASEGMCDDLETSEQVREILSTTCPNLLLALKGNLESVDVEALSSEIQEFSISLQASTGLLRVHMCKERRSEEVNEETSASSPLNSSKEIESALKNSLSEIETLKEDSIEEDKESPDAADYTTLKPIQLKEQHIESLLGKLQQYQSRMDALQLHIHQVQGLLGGVTDEKEKLLNQNSELEDAMLSMARELEDANKRLLDSQDVVKQLQEAQKKEKREDSRRTIKERAKAILAAKDKESLQQSELVSRIGELEAVLQEVINDKESKTRELSTEIEDLKQQLEVADRQLRSSRQFLEEQASDRELELEEMNRAQESISSQTKENSSLASQNEKLHKDVENLEKDVRDKILLIEKEQKRKEELQNDVLCSMEKCKDLQDIMQSLEGQLKVKTANEDGLLSKIELLKLELQKPNNLTDAHLQEQEREVLFVTSFDNYPEGETPEHPTVPTPSMHHSLYDEMEAEENAGGSFSKESNMLMLQNIFDKMERSVLCMEGLSCSRTSPFNASEEMCDEPYIRDQFDLSAGSLDKTCPISPSRLEQLLEEKFCSFERAAEAAAKHFSDLEMRLRNLKLEYDETVAERNLLLEDISKLQLENHKQSEAVIHFTDRMNELFQEPISIDEFFTKLKKDQEQLQSTLNDKETMRIKLEHKRTYLENTIAEISSERDQLQQQNSEQLLKISGLEARLDEFRRADSPLEYELKLRISALQENLESKRTELNKKYRETEELRYIMNETHSKLLLREEEIGKLKDSLHLRENKQERLKIEELEYKIVELKEEILVLSTTGATKTIPDVPEVRTHLVIQDKINPATETVETNSWTSRILHSSSEEILRRDAQEELDFLQRVSPPCAGKVLSLMEETPNSIATLDASTNLSLEDLKSQDDIGNNKYLMTGGPDTKPLQRLGQLENMTELNERILLLESKELENEEKLQRLNKRTNIDKETINSLENMLSNSERKEEAASQKQRELQDEIDTVHSELESLKKLYHDQKIYSDRIELDLKDKTSQLEELHNLLQSTCRAHQQEINNLLQEHKTHIQNIDVVNLANEKKICEEFNNKLSEKSQLLLRDVPELRNAASQTEQDQKILHRDAAETDQDLTVRMQEEVTSSKKLDRSILTFFQGYDDQGDLSRGSSCLSEGTNHSVADKMQLLMKKIYEDGVQVLSLTELLFLQDHQTQLNKDQQSMINKTGLQNLEASVRQHLETAEALKSDRKNTELLEFASQQEKLLADELKEMMEAERRHSQQLKEQLHSERSRSIDSLAANTQLTCRNLLLERQMETIRHELEATKIQLEENEHQLTSVKESLQFERNNFNRISNTLNHQRSLATKTSDHQNQLIKELRDNLGKERAKTIQLVSQLHDAKHGSDSSREVSVLSDTNLLSSNGSYNELLKQQRDSQQKMTDKKSMESSLLDDLVRERNRVEELRRLNINLTAENEILLARMKRKSSMIDELESKLKFLRNDPAALLNQRRELEVELSHQRQTNERLCAEISDLKSTLKIMNTENYGGTLQRENADPCSSYFILTQDKIKMRQRITTLEGMVERLNHRLTVSQAVNEDTVTTQARNQALVSERTAMLHELQDAKSKCTAAQRELQEYKTQQEMVELTQSPQYLAAERNQPDTRTRYWLWKYRRCNCYLKSLCWQKRYLLFLLSGYQGSELQTISSLSVTASRVLGRERVLNSLETRTRIKGISKFRSLAYALIFIKRTCSCSKYWQLQRWLKGGQRVDAPPSPGSSEANLDFQITGTRSLTDDRAPIEMNEGATVAFSVADTSFRITGSTPPTKENPPKRRAEFLSRNASSLANRNLFDFHRDGGLDDYIQRLDSIHASFGIATDKP